jgi:wobble nucleotide-excising tRNase
MCIKKIHKIQNIGSFYHLQPERDLVFDKFNLIYGENGSGKSTISSIFKSLSLNNENIILDKKSILKDSENIQPSCELVLDAFAYKFESSQWNSCNPNSNYKPENIIIFDDEFIEKNIFTFSDADINHAKNQYKIIFGEKAVKLNFEKQLLVLKNKNDLKPKLETEKNNFLLKYKTSLEEYSKLKFARTEEGLNLELIEINLQIKAIKNNLSINSISFKKLVQIDIVDQNKVIELYENLISDIKSKAHLDAKKQVEEFKKQHFHPRTDGDSFLKYGIHHVKTENGNICPLCHNIFDSELLDVYRNYFDKEYENFIEKLNDIKGGFFKISDQQKNLIVYSSDTNSKVYSFWKEYIKEITEPKINILDLIDSFNLVIDNIYQQIEFKKQETVKINFFKLRLLQIQIQISTFINDYNELVLNNNQKIEEYKKNNTKIDLTQLNQKKSALVIEMELVRKKDNIINDLAAITKLEQEIKGCEQAIKQLDGKINDEISNISKDFIDRVNGYLENENFKLDLIIPKNHSNQTELHCEIYLKFFEKPLKLYARDGSVKEASKTLSTGEKRTLGFGFFMVSLEMKNDLSKKVVVFDDPITSLDYNRILEVTRKIHHFSTKVSQVFVLTHDKQLFCHLYKELEKNGIMNNNIKYLKIDKTVSLGSDINEIVKESKDMRFLTNEEHHYNHFVLNQFSLGANIHESPANLLRQLFEDLLEYKFPDEAKKIKNSGRGKTLFTTNSMQEFTNNNCVSQNVFNSLKGGEGEVNILDFANSESHSSININGLTTTAKQNIVKKALKIFRNI